MIFLAGPNFALRSAESFCFTSFNQYYSATSVLYSETKFVNVCFVCLFFSMKVINNNCCSWMFNVMLLVVWKTWVTYSILHIYIYFFIYDNLVYRMTVDQFRVCTWFVLKLNQLENTWRKRFIWGKQGDSLIFW